jgi:two-component system, OmpR family, sensor kinase
MLVMMLRRPATLRARLLTGLLVVATAVILVFDVATITALRDWQTRRIDGNLNKVVQTHRGRAAELLTAGAPPQLTAHLTPNDYYMAIATAGPADDQGIVPMVTSDTTPALPADLADLARSGQIRTVPGTDGSSHFRLRAAETGAGVLVVAANLRSVTDAIRSLQVILATGTIIAIAVLALGGAIVVRRGLRPLETMATQADRITAGDLTRPVAPHTPDTEVGRLGHALNRMLARIQSSVQQQQAAQERMRRFFADASHELRTPLTALRANAELHEQGALTTRAQVDEAMRRIRLSAQRMSTLVDDMLRLARLDQHPPQLWTTIDLSALLTESLRDARAADSDRTWVGQIQPALQLQGDPELIRRAIDNLLANIRTHTPPGTTATVIAHQHDDHILIDVHDNGPGVPDHAQPRLFDRFYRVNEHHTGSGSGLGLAIVAEIATSHGGNAAATTSTPHGLRIHLTLPIHPQHRPDTGQADA